MISEDKMRERLQYFASNEDIKRCIGCSDEHIMKYSELANYNSLEQLLPNTVDYKIILVETNRNSGHWVCVLRKGNVIECFNSYGIPIDSEFKYIPDWIERWLGEDTRYLTNLIKASKGFTVVSNKVPFQENINGINTCGRWVILRIELHRLGYSLDEFVKVIQSASSKQDLEPDELVCLWIKFTSDRK
jgi:hypothetical protein